MLRYLLRRTAIGLLTLFTVTVATFWLFFAVPVDPAQLQCGKQCTEAQLQQIRTSLGLDPSQLGLVLLAVATGSFVILPIAGTIVQRYGSRRSLTAMALLQTLALCGVAIGVSRGVAPVVVGFFLLGLSSGLWDVSMNVHGASVERRAGRSMMPRFHAAFSIGTVVGAGIGVGMVALHVPVAEHLVIVACLVSAIAVPANATGVLGPKQNITRPTTATTVSARITGTRP